MSITATIWAANLVMLLHFSIVLFVVAGLALIILGNLRGWHRLQGLVNSWLFRLAHLTAIAVVVMQSWLGITCPLTTLEHWLRQQAGQAGYNTGFIEFWVHQLMYYQAPSWVFTAAYTAFAAMVIGAWWKWPPVGKKPN